MVPVHSSLDKNKDGCFGVTLIVSDVTASCVRGSGIASVCVVDGDEAGCISLSASFGARGLCESRGGRLYGQKVALNVNAQCAPTCPCFTPGVGSRAMSHIPTVVGTLRPGVCCVCRKNGSE